MLGDRPKKFSSPFISLLCFKFLVKLLFIFFSMCLITPSVSFSVRVENRVDHNDHYNECNSQLSSSQSHFAGKNHHSH